VRVLLRDTYTLPFQSNPNPKKVQEILESIGIHCLLDDSHLGLLNHPLEAHHQKTAIIDGRLAFVVGLDLMMQNSGEYDRWDTKSHPFHSPLRLGKDGNMPLSHYTKCLPRLSFLKSARLCSRQTVHLRRESIPLAANVYGL
jgi:hypothetical protein